MITGRIKDITIDQNGLVKVTTDYFDENNVLVYEDGVTRYSWHVTSSKEEMMARIEKEIQDHAQTLLRGPLILKKNQDLVAELRNELIDAEVSVEEATIVTDSKVIKVDGKKIVSSEERSKG